MHSVDASLAHMVIARTHFPILACHDAFASHASNVFELRLAFMQNLNGMHLSGKPLQNFRSDVLGDPRPMGLLGWDETIGETISILHKIEAGELLQMIG